MQGKRQAELRETAKQRVSVVPVCVLVCLNWELSIFVAGRTRTSRKLMSQLSAMCTQTQSVEPAGTHGDYGVITDWDLIVFLELCSGKGRHNQERRPNRE